MWCKIIIAEANDQSCTELHNENIYLFSGFTTSGPPVVRSFVTSIFLFNFIELSNTGRHLIIIIIIERLTLLFPLLLLPFDGCSGSAFICVYILFLFYCDIFRFHYAPSSDNSRHVKHTKPKIRNESSNSSSFQHHCFISSDALSHQNVGLCVCAHQKCQCARFVRACVCVWVGRELAHWTIHIVYSNGFVVL